MIAVLAADCSEALLREILDDMEGRGWKAEVSRGAEQILVAVAGPEELEELEELVAARTDGDVLELLSRRDYRRKYNSRRLMHGLVAGLGLLIAFGVALPTLGFLRPPVIPRNPPESVRAGKLSELAENSARLLRLDRRAVLLVRMRGMQLYALDATCTHTEACLLEWDPERLQIQCPCHGCVFDVYGNVVRAPASIPLASLSVDWLGDEIVVSR